MRLKLNICIALLLAAGVTGNATTITMDDSPAEPGSWGFRPSEAYPPALNPPGFTWRPAESAAIYWFQVAADPDFTDLLVDTRSNFNAYCPAKSFGAGTYYWRVRAVAQDGEESDWGAVRPFTITGDETEFPRPSMRDLTRAIATEHPRLMIRPERLERLRELAQGPLRSDWEAILKRADALLESPPDTTEPPLYPEGMERKSGEWKKIWWGNRTRAIAAADGAATLAFAYQLSGDARYGKAARDILMEVAKWDPKGSTNYRYNDEAAMPLLYLPARAYSWAHDQFSDEDRALLREVWAVRGQDCFNHLIRGQQLWRPYNSHSNRAWHKLGELSIAFIDEIPEASQWLELATAIFWTCYPVWGGNDGGWHEGLAYWTSYLERFMHWALASDAAFGIDVFQKPFFSETGYFGLYTLPPGGEAGAWGDQAINVASKRIAPLMAALAAGARNPHWQWYADQHEAKPGSGYIGFLLQARASGITAESPASLPESRAFTDTGIAVLNTSLLDGKDNVQVHFKSSFWGRQSHGYNSNNAFMLYANGAPLLLSTGRRDVHGSPHHTQWMWESKSDNAILVNGEGQKKHSSLARGRIIDFRTSNTLDLVVGEAADSYEGRLKRWTRRILFFKPHAVLIHDLLEAPEPATYQFLLHAPGKFDLGQNTALYDGPAGRVKAEFLLPAGLDISQSGEFDVPPAEWSNFDLDEWHLQAATTSPAARQEFLTLLTINGAEVTVEGGANAGETEMHVTTPGGQWRLQLDWDNFVVND